MTSNVSVRRVAGPADQKVLLSFPWTVYKDDPHWVPPLVSMRRDKLNPRKNPTLAILDIEYFIAWRGTTPVGTIAAFINHHHNKFHKEHIGWFGLFEVLDDREAALALLSTAEEWVRAKGYDAIRGPASFNDLDEFGLQVDGFGPPHVLLMPYNPPYYMTYIEAAGYKGVMDMVSYRILAADMMGENMPPKLRRVIGKLRERSKITMRLPDMKHLDHEIELLEQLYIGAWSDNWGFVPPTHEEMVYLINQLKPFFDPRMGLIAEIDGRPVGFVLLFPDLNQAIGPARPHPNTPEIITLLRILWHWKVRRKVNRVRVPFLGVLEEYRGRGIDAMLYMDIIEPAVQMGFHEGDFGWILLNNQAMVQVADLVRGEIYKTFRMYEKRLKPVSDAVVPDVG